MEDMIINHTYSLDILLELVKYYTVSFIKILIYYVQRAIEYYDFMQDAI